MLRFRNKSLSAYPPSGKALHRQWEPRMPARRLRVESALRRNWLVLRRAAAGWLRHDATSLAAALSYYAAFSLAPILMIAISITARIFGEAASRGAVQYQLAGAVGEKSANLIESMVDSAGKSGANGTMAVIGFATLLVSAGGVFNQLKDSLNRIWEVPEKENSGVWDFLKGRLISTSMVFGTGILMLLSLVASTALTAVVNYLGGFISGSVVMMQIANPLLSLTIFTLVFASIFRVLPDVEIRWRDVWSGALLTAILFTVGKAALAAYLGREGTASTYGAAGAMMLVLLWIYYSSLILIFGAEFTAAHARQRRQTKPRPEAPSGS